MKTIEETRHYILEQTVQLLEVKAAKAEDERWLRGAPGMILEGKMAAFQELIDWIDES